MNYLRTVIYCITSLLFVVNAKGQNNSKSFSSSEYTPIYLSYYGNLLSHPGIKVGFDWNLLIKEINKNKRKPKTIHKVFFISPNLSFYHHQHSHKGLNLGLDAGYRRYNNRLFYRELNIGTYYHRRYNEGDTWEVSEDGSINNIGTSSRGYFSPSLSFAIGKRFKLKENIPLDVFARLNSFIFLGYAAGTSADVNIEIGARIDLNRGIKRGIVPSRIKNK